MSLVFGAVTNRGIIKIQFFSFSEISCITILGFSIETILITERP